MRLVIASIITALSGAAALAQDGSAPTDTAELYPRLPGVEYYCTDAAGTRVELGGVICITASCTTWMAKCEMTLNTPMWRKLQDGCPTAGVRARLEALKPRA